jgi:uridylate kinase
MEKTYVISLGGSLVSPDNLDIDFLQNFRDSLIRLPEEIKFGIVVGGGKLARNYIRALKKAGVNDNILDEIGINATRMNALALSAFLPDSNSKIPVTVNDAAELSRIYRFTIMGGTEPGHTTDTVSMLLAERIGAKTIINATSVDGVYTADPRKDKNARKMQDIGYDEAIKIALEESVGAGPNVFMDLTALNIAKRSGIRVFVVNGRNIANFHDIIMKGKSDGSIIK